MELMMEPGLAQREPCISRPCDARLKYRRERIARDAPWRSERAFAASAVRRAVPLLMASAPQPRIISPGTTVRVPVRFAARLTRAAAHHQVECQYRNAQDARKNSHRNPGYYSPWHRGQTMGGKPRRKPPPSRSPSMQTPTSPLSAGLSHHLHAERSGLSLCPQRFGACPFLTLSSPREGRGYQVQHTPQNMHQITSRR